MRPLQLATTSLFLFLATASFCQETLPPDPYQNFVVLYTTGENWDTTKQTFEQAYFREHSSHLAELRKKKVIDVGGRYSKYGMLIIRATDEAEAKDLIHEDLAIRHKLFNVEIFPINVFYKGCIE